METTVSLKEAEELIAQVGKDLTVHLRGQPGIGKSTLLTTLAKRFPDHTPVYIDCADLDLGDLAMPAMNHETKTTAFYPNERFAVHKGTPVLVMLDEITKASEPVKNMLLPVMLERRLGAVEFHPDSIVFSTGNLTTDAVGDHLKAHAKNRVSQVTVRNPSDEEWLEWGSKNDQAPEVLAWVHQFPHCLACYTDKSQEENMYIYNPAKQQDAFVSPRSLAKSSFIVKARHELGENATMVALAGTIGEAAARDMSAFFSLADGLPSRQAVYSSPDTAKLPDDPAARVILVMREIQAYDKKTFDAVVTYMKRFPKELQALFFHSITKSPHQFEVAKLKSFMQWVNENHQFL
tara:strand:- start:15181 stop:16227 length:1047 start_codon:yes stop_codon:yes gene_type:complete